MTGSELTEQLIEDINICIQAQGISRINDQLKRDFAIYTKDRHFNLDYSIEESWISMSFDITIPYALSDLTQLINIGETVLNFKNGEKADVNNYLAELITNKQKVSEIFQKIKDNKSLIFITSQYQQPLFTLLEDKLNNIHREAQMMNNCYKFLIEKKK